MLKQFISVYKVILYIGIIIITRLYYILELLNFIQLA